MSGAYPIKVASQKSGLSVHAIRVWEHRYAAITPERSSTKRRLYTDAEIARLKLLHEVTRAGYSIGSVARLPDEQLRVIASENAPLLATPSPISTSSGDIVVDGAVAAIRKLDAKALEAALRAALVQFGLQAVLMKVISPLATVVGDQWRKGEISAAHEHFATAVIRDFLTSVQKQFSTVPGAPRLMVATPVGQLHELGAILCAAAAGNLGWNVIYLGASLPAAELAGVAISNKARAVALSVVFPENDPTVTSELTALGGYLPAETKIIIGGRAARSYQNVLGSFGGVLVDSLDDLCLVLDSLWSRTTRTGQ